MCRKERKKNHRCYEHIRADGVGQLATFIVANDVSFRFPYAKHLMFSVRTVQKYAYFAEICYIKPYIRFTDII